MEVAARRQLVDDEIRANRQRRRESLSRLARSLNNVTGTPTSPPENLIDLAINPDESQDDVFVLAPEFAETSFNEQSENAERGNDLVLADNGQFLPASQINAGESGAGESGAGESGSGESRSHNSSTNAVGNVSISISEAWESVDFFSSEQRSNILQNSSGSSGAGGSESRESTHWWNPLAASSALAAPNVTGELADDLAFANGAGGPQINEEVTGAEEMNGDELGEEEEELGEKESVDEEESVEEEEDAEEESKEKTEPSSEAQPSGESSNNTAEQSTSRIGKIYIKFTENITE